MEQTKVQLCGEIALEGFSRLIQRYGFTLERVDEHHPIPGSWFGDPEAGIIGCKVFVRGDTPVHSAFHETCHLICMDSQRRDHLHTDAGGDYDEENAVNYIQVTLAQYLPSMGRERMFKDMDSWGYTFRLGSARAWFEHDAEDARQWLIAHDLLHHDGEPTWKCRQ
jgi:hypothetical protein